MPRCSTCKRHRTILPTKFQNVYENAKEIVKPPREYPDSILRFPELEKNFLNIEIYSDALFATKPDKQSQLE